jgi:hypothetical protein
MVATAFEPGGGDPRGGVDMSDVITGPEDCTCANVCPEYAHCICIADLEAHICRIYCTDEVIAVKQVFPVNGEEADAAARMPLDRRVNLDVRGASLGEAGTLIAAIADAQIYVPAGRLDERREISLRDVTLETVVRELELMAIVA